MAGIRFLGAIFMAVFLLAATQTMAGSGAHSGKVIQAMTAGGYTYMEIDERGQKYWIAGPQTSLGVGAMVSFDEQIWMKNFHSKSLDKRFDRILFVSAVVPATGESSAAKPAAKAAKTTKKAKAAKPAGPAKLCTVVELYDNSQELNGKLIKVKGKVVKVSENIMGRTWVHIEDGSSSGPFGKVIFRSVDGKAAVGETVTAQGRLETDKDFGFGYKYSVIVEDSTFEK